MEQQRPRGGGRVEEDLGVEESSGRNSARQIDASCGLRNPIKHIAVLIPPERFSGRYAVSFRGEIIVESSRDPETALARALLARGFVGKVRVIDARTGRHRSTVDIESAARLTVREDAHNSPRF